MKGTVRQKDKEKGEEENGTRQKSQDRTPGQMKVVQGDTKENCAK